MISTSTTFGRAARPATGLALAFALAACATTSAPPAAGPAAPAGPSFSEPLRLVGTEPFWGGRIGPDGITLSGAERPELQLPVVPPAVSAAGARWVTPGDNAPAAAPSTVIVTASQPGASAEAMQNNVVRPIETALYNIDGVHRIGAAHSPGRSIITVGFTPGPAEARAQAVREALRGVRLPARAGAEVTLARPQPVDITLLRKTCSDGMSDRTYPFEATVIMSGETLRGCAIPERQWSTAP